jgi:hypothetical protein
MCVLRPKNTLDSLYKAFLTQETALSNSFPFEAHGVQTFRTRHLDIGKLSLFPFPLPVNAELFLTKLASFRIQLSNLEKPEATPIAGSRPTFGQ